MNVNKLFLDLSESPELKEYLSRQKPGDKCRFEIEASIDEVTGDTASLSVVDAQAVKEGETEAEKEDEGMGESDGEPVMQVMRKKKAHGGDGYKPGGEK